MNLYDRRRWFGDFPEVSADTLERDTDKVLSDLKKDRRNHPGDPDRLSVLLGFALARSRLDSLSDFLSPEDWGADPPSVLHRGHLRLYRAVAESPDAPETLLLDQAADDFSEAAGHSASYPEAQAALARVAELRGEHTKALAILRRLERFPSRADRRAAVGLRLFFADRPETGATARHRHLNTAGRHLRRCRPERRDRLLAAEVDYLLGNFLSAENTWKTEAAAGSAEASFHLLLHRMNTLMKTRDPILPKEREAFLEELRQYRNACPADPRARMLEGEFLVGIDPEAARLAWRGALVLDDRHAPAWGRLGDLYREARERGADEHVDAWLEAAIDAYTRAATLAPLEGRYRKMIGMMEREAGHPAQAVGALTAALALERDNRESLRLLALSWTDLAYSGDMTPEARTAAAGRARSRWMELLQRDRRNPFDVIGVCRAAALEYPATGRVPAANLNLIDSMLPELLRDAGADLAADLIPLAEDFLAAGLTDRIPAILSKAGEFLPGDHRLPAIRAAVTLPGNPAESRELYLEAAAAAGTGHPDYPEWLRRAASVSLGAGDAGEGMRILREGLKKRPGDRVLLRDLAMMLRDAGRAGEAVGAYRDALARDPEAVDLLEDAIWFARESDLDREAREFLDRALEVNPGSGRTWNQLGVHLMETGWDDDYGEQGGLPEEVLKEAIDSYRKAVDAEPGNNVYRGNLGDALRQSGQWTEAEELLQDALGKASDRERTTDGAGDAFARNSLARLVDERSYATEGSESSAEDWESAGENYWSATEADPGNVDYLRDYAWWLYRERRLEEAAALYRKAGSLDPGDEALPYGESSCWKELGDEGKAMEALDRALAIRSDDPVMMADKASLLGALGDHRGAEKLFNRVIALTDGAGWVLERLGNYFEDRAGEVAGFPGMPRLDSDGRLSVDKLLPVDRNPESRDLYGISLQAREKAREKEPEDSYHKRRAGIVLLSVGRLEESREFLKESLEHSPADAPALDLLGLMDLADALAVGIDTDRGRLLLEKGGRRLADARELTPAVAAFHAHLGYCRAQEGEWAAARGLFAEAWERDREEAAHAANAGISALKAGEYEAAVRFLRKAVLEEEDAEWQNALGLALLSSGSPELAVEAFSSACLSNPANEVYPANLVLAHRGVQGITGPLQ